MEIKSISFIVRAVLALSFLTACDTFPIKSRDRESQVPAANSGVIAVEAVEEKPEATPPQFLQKAQPKIGLILSPGGALSYAHIGVLHEFEKQRIPVHAIGGMEWGALVAGAYAHQGKAHGVEWKLLKFPQDLFEKSGFFQSGRKQAAIEDLSGFFRQTFEGKAVSSGPVAFACPYVDLPALATRVASGVKYEDRLQKCLPYPPFFSLRDRMAQPLAINELAEALRALGADKIVYVDVLSQNKLGSFGDKTDQLLWAQIRNQRFSGVDHIIHVKLPGGGLTQFKEARSLIRQGQLKAKSQVQELGQQYAF